MESKQPTRTLEQVVDKSDEEAETVEGETKTLKKENKTSEEKTKTLEDLEQTDQEETKKSEETKADKAKDSNQEKMITVELNEQALNILSVFNNCAQIDMIMEEQGGDKVLEFIKQMRSSSLIEILKGKEYEILTERMLNANKIINKIQNSLENLKCWAKDCPHKAILIYADENIDQIYCSAHEDATKHLTEAIIFENEFNKWKPVLRNLEKRLLFLQVKMIIIIIIRSQNNEENLYEKILEDLESKLKDIKNIIITMKKKIRSLTKLFNSETEINGKERSKYRSLSFIQDDCEKCSKIIHEILLAIFETSLGRQIELLIYVLDNASRGTELDDESKFNSYIEVPDEIYGKTYKMIDISFQSRLLMRNFQKKIKKTFKYAETNQKVKINK